LVSISIREKLQKRVSYQASLKLEGITTTAQTTQQSKAEILQKYKKYSQPET